MYVYNNIMMNSYLPCPPPFQAKISVLPQSVLKVLDTDMVMFRKIVCILKITQSLLFTIYQSRS